MEEWLGQGNLIVANQPGVPTFQRYAQESTIDLTICTGQVYPKITKWTVLEDVTLSWHKAILFGIQTSRRKKEIKQHQQTRGWKLIQDKVSDLQEELQKRMPQGTITAQTLTTTIQEACNSTLSRKKAPRGKGAVYWWTTNITKYRQACIRARRDFTKANRRRIPEEIEDKRELYRSVRKQLRKEIKNAKKEAWDTIIQDLDRDIWGQGYKIVTGRLRQHHRLSDDLQMTEAKKLFPRVGPTSWPVIPIGTRAPNFTEEELENAVTNLKTGKAAGPDNISPEIAKAAIGSQKEVFLRVANDAIQRRKFPSAWKEARLVLIEKPRKTITCMPAYRPICLLSILGKILEAMIGRRIADEIDTRGGLAERQYGFRKGRSTIQAMEEVLKILETNTKKRNERGFAVMVTIDVKNAFNSVRWENIIQAMTKKGINSYLTAIIKDYLQGRKILVGQEEEIEMECGVPQGSKLGPLLWNLSYDDILRIPMPSGTAAIGFADDIAIVVTAWTVEDLQLKTKVAVDFTTDWLRKAGLTVAAQKTEAVLLAGRRTLTSMEVMVEGHQTTTTQSVKYLGVHFDKDVKMKTHIRRTAEKAAQVASKLSRVLPNINGPSAGKRKALHSVVMSIITYGAPVWRKAMNFEKYRQMFIRIQRTMAIRVCSAYRTISTPAVQLLAGVIPVDLLIEERIKVHDQEQGTMQDFRKQTLDRWQARWEREDKGSWTRRMIPDIHPWIQRQHGNMDFHLTQFMSGHGCFQAQLHRFRRATSDNCVYCGRRDTAEHTIFECPKWGRSRNRLEEELDTTLSPENTIPIMLSSLSQWEAVKKFVNNILGEKEEDERKRQKEERQATNTQG